MIYEKIYDFCKVKNLGSVFKNTDSPTPRVEFLLNLLVEEGIPYELDKFIIDEVIGYNIILRGDSDKMLVAHHDIVNPNVDNANDNSASVINAIALKKMSPHIHVVLLDGEEFGGYGSQRVSEQILEGEFGEISYVLNLTYINTPLRIQLFNKYKTKPKVLKALTQMYPNVKKFQILIFVRCSFVRFLGRLILCYKFVLKQLRCLIIYQDSQL